jgi:hypothetical protein
MATQALKYWLSGFLLLLLNQVSAEPAESEIKPFQANYQLIRNGIPFGHVEVTLQLDPQGHYHYVAKTRPNILTALLSNQTLTEESRGRLTQNEPVPDHYNYHKTKPDQSSTTRIGFDWLRKRATTNNNGTSWSMPIPLGTQDKLSQQLAIQIALLQGQDSISFDVADGGHLKRYHYKREKLERLVTPLGEMTTVKVKRSKQSTHDYTIWFAPSLNYLPVRFERKQPSGLFIMKLLFLQEPHLNSQ